MISIENLSFSYRRGARALDDLSVEIGHDTITGLFGRNGSGKSTLGMLIAGLLPIRRTRGRAAGSIFIDGHPVDENPEVMPGGGLYSGPRGGDFRFPARHDDGSVAHGPPHLG